jgi:2-polyprenyl-3-methyl-5-hydroxy-6-metoxy-1,4-benzoquinol methylase
MTRAVTSADLAEIAARCDNRWDYHYTKSKLARDPIYAAVIAALDTNSLPVLDIGCGMGLLAHYLRAAGSMRTVHGFDFDPRKIRSAAAMALRGGMQDCHFHCGDAREALPAFQGNVVILDVLQYLQPEAQRELLLSSAAKVPMGARLILRSGLCDASWRYKITVAGDWLAKGTRWMKAAPVAYPSAEGLRQTLSEAGLDITISPLWGATPFNNHLILAERRRL